MTDEQKLANLIKKMGLSNNVRVVANNMSEGIIDQFNLPFNENMKKAISEAFVRGANWRLLQIKRKEERENTNE